MVGQMDLSLIPAGFIDDISIYYGGGSMSITSGGFGGVIDLETNPDWDDKELFSINPAIGSLWDAFRYVKGKSRYKRISVGYKSIH